MGRKKLAVGADDEELQVRASGVVKKNRKKDHVVDDDEYSIATTESVDSQETVDQQTLKGMDHHKITEEVPKSLDDTSFANKNQKEKKGKKALAENIEDGESGKKKGKKGKKEFKVDDDEFDIGDSVKSGSVSEVSTLDDLDVIPVSKPPKKQQVKKGSQADAFSLLASLDNEKTALQELQQAEGDLNDDDAEGIVFTGKKKKKVSKSRPVEVLNESGVDKTSEHNENLDVSPGEEKPMEGDEEPTIIFSGKKKSKSKKGALASSFVYGTIPGEEAVGAVTNIKGDAEFGGMADIQGTSDLPESTLASKKQTKKKKGGRTVQEEEDLDKILAELGEVPVSTKPVPSVTKKEHAIDEKLPSAETESVMVVGQGSVEPPVTADVEAEVEESAAAKKKKKKKEKEKEKKAAAAAAGADENQGTVVKEEPQDAKSKVSDKKVPKHVREMQERLAKLKEAEEKKKREEEERLRKEEEERLRLEELEKQKEEAKRRKKEREKEKLQKKKQEGKLLTGKQKEEARRLALMREQFLAQGGLPTDDAAVPKKPKYESRKKKATPSHPSEKTLEMEGIAEPKPEQLDIEKVEDEKLIDENMNEEIEPEPEPEEEIEEDEDEWDAKSWDEDVVLPPIKSAFEEEDADPVMKKGTKHVLAPSSASVSLKTANVPSESARNAASGKATSSRMNDHDEEDESGDEAGGAKKKKDTAVSREERRKEALAKRSADDLRSPICCILGHVDTGKTKLLDCIRRTNVQEGEAGGITQQIGATYFPMENIRERTKELKVNAELRVPGLLVIDTPGHESFTNLRSRGTGLCDIAILVIDIMHGLEQQTIESINLLKFRKTPFVVALNKVDRLYSWKSTPNGPIQKVLKQQSKDTTLEFERRLSEVITQLKEQGLNSELYYRNKELAKYVSIVPTSAISGEGVPDLLMLLVQLTQKRMEQKLMFISEVECTVLEVKVIEGLGTTIDVVLVNGVLHEGDQIVVCGMQGPIVTNIRALLTPHPMKELRVKGTYQHHKELKAAQGIKITAQGLEHAIAGTQLYVVGSDDDLEQVKKETMSDMENIMKKIDKSGEGVCVQASTLGSLEALLEYLKSVKVPVSGISIGPVHKKDVMRASVMLERKKKEFAVILAFDVKVTPEAKELAEEAGVRIFMADIIYHLFDRFTAYMNNLKEEKKRESAAEAVFPCILRIVPNCIFNQKDPIILGVDVLEGILKVGTPICVPSRDFICIGRIASIEDNHKHVDVAKRGLQVAVKIVGSNPEEAQKMFNRHFTLEDDLVSQISRRSIDVLKENYREDLRNERSLVRKLKKIFKIQ